MQPLVRLSHRHSSDRGFFWHATTSSCITVELNVKIYFYFPIQFIAHNTMTLGHESTVSVERDCE